MSNALPLPARPASSLNRLAEMWRDAVRACRRALAAPSHEAIDDLTLRDLGMSRSELGSYAAEASGRAELTRQRVIASQGVQALRPGQGAFE